METLNIVEYKLTTNRFQKSRQICCSSKSATGFPCDLSEWPTSPL